MYIDIRLCNVCYDRVDSGRRMVLVSASSKTRVWQATSCACATVQKSYMSGWSVCTMSCMISFRNLTWVTILNCRWHRSWSTQVDHQNSLVPRCAWLHMGMRPITRGDHVHILNLDDSFAAEMLVNSLHLIPKHFWDISVMLVSNHCLRTELPQVGTTSFCTIGKLRAVWRPRHQRPQSKWKYSDPTHLGEGFQYHCELNDALTYPNITVFMV